MITKRSLISVLSAIALCFGAMTSAAQAQATRTWVSGVGNDANSCTRTAPCKTFGVAATNTAAGGEIDALDPGDFDSFFTIFKAITIDGGGGQVASMSKGSGSPTIQVNAGPSDRVILRNLRINGTNQAPSSPGNGIAFNSGLALSVENCYISGYNSYGINFQPSTRAFLTVTNTVLTGNGTFGGSSGGAFIASTTSGVNRVTLTNVTVSNNVSGITAGQNTKLQLMNVAIGETGAGGGGFGLIANGTAAEINVDQSAISNNQFGGIHAANGGLIRVGNSAITGNNTNGIVFDSGGIVSSYGNNQVNGNAGTQTFSPGILPQT